MSAILHDARFTLRLAMRRPLVTLVALASLMTGVALATVVFTLVNAILLKPLPVREPDRLALLSERRSTGPAFTFAYPDFVDYRRAQQAMADLVAWSSVDAALLTGAGAQLVEGELVTGSFFDTLGVDMRFGRALLEDDDRDGAPPVVVVSEALWELVGGGDTFEPRVVTLNGTAFDIVGVVQPPFSGMQIGRRAAFWVPMTHQPRLEAGRSVLGERRASWLFVMGRLRDGVTLEQAEADLRRIESSMAAVADHRPMQLALVPGARGQSALPEHLESTLSLLLGAAFVVLIIAAANLANLLMARTADRSREFAIRASLGASRFTVLRLVAVEAVLLGAAAAIGSLAIAQWMVSLVLPLIRFFGDPVWLDVALDARTVAFALGAGLCAAAAAGVAPVLQVWRMRTREAVEGTRSAAPGATSSRIRAASLVTQFALSLALVTVATLFVRTVSSLLATPTGYDTDHVALLSVDPTTVTGDSDAIRQYIDEAESRLRAVPGVRAVGFARVTPIGFGGSRMSVSVPGYEPAPGEDMELNFNAISDGYFAAAGIALRAGRELTALDREGAPLVVVINETMAARYWNRRDVVGERFMLGDQEVEVVGVAPDVKYRTMREAPRPSFYVSVRQLPPRGGTFHVRTQGSPDAMLPTLRDALAAADPRVPVASVRTLRQQVEDNVNDDRLAMLIGALLGSTALLLAAAGLFASMWDAVGRRTREIGVRLALGADTGRVRWLVLHQAMVLVMIGSVLGAALAFWGGRLVESRLYGVSPHDPASLGLAWGVLAAVALAASWAPTARASRVDPVVALRDD